MSHGVRKLISQFDDAMLQAAMTRFNMHGPCENQNGYENHVYRCLRLGEPVILRIGHTEHRTTGEVCAELAFLKHLHAEGCPVVRPLTSTTGQTIETLPIRDDDYFVVAAFTVAPGETLNLTTADKDIIKSLGETTARLHQSSRTFSPASSTCKRPTWDRETLNLLNRVTARKLLSEDDAVVLAHVHDVINIYQTKLKTARDYGLIHADIHDTNFTCKGTTLTLFDFDDALYGHYAYDLAVTLVETFSYERDDFTAVHTFLEHWLEGYTLVAPFPKQWLEELEFLMTARILSSFLFVKQNADGATSAWEEAHYQFCRTLAARRTWHAFDIRSFLQNRP